MYKCQHEKAQRRLRKNAKNEAAEELEEKAEAKPKKKATAKAKGKIKASPKKKKRTPKKKKRQMELENSDRQEDEDINSEALALEAEEEEIKNTLREEDARGGKRACKKNPGCNEAGLPVNRILKFSASDIDDQGAVDEKTETKPQAHANSSISSGSCFARDPGQALWKMLEDEAPATPKRKRGRAKAKSSGKKRKKTCALQSKQDHQEKEGDRALQSKQDHKEKEGDCALQSKQDHKEKEGERGARGSDSDSLEEAPCLYVHIMTSIMSMTSLHVHMLPAAEDLWPDRVATGWTPDLAKKSRTGRQYDESNPMPKSRKRIEVTWMIWVITRSCMAIRFHHTCN